MKFTSKGNVILTEREANTVLGVFGGCYSLGYDKLNTFLGSLTIERMEAMYLSLQHMPYCFRHGIQHYEDMTEADFENEYIENAVTESEWYDAHYE